MRMPSAVSPVLSRCGLTAASRGDYADWMQERRRAAVPGKAGELPCALRWSEENFKGWRPATWPGKPAGTSGWSTAGRMSCAGPVRRIRCETCRGGRRPRAGIRRHRLDSAGTGEPQTALDALGRFSAASGIPLAFDPRAYRISSSKIMSDRLFAELQISAPQPWPDAVFPIMAKPSGSSGSRGIRIIRSADQLRAEFPGGGAAAEWVVQEYLPGPSYSLEVIAVGGGARCFQVTDLFVDAGLRLQTGDRRRPSCPRAWSPNLSASVSNSADAIDLRGLMDVEVILNGGELKVLEIDARLPSQTPTAVFWSSVG